MMALIKGIQKTSMVDYPGRIATTLFFSTCNYKCGFCYNVDIVRDNPELEVYSEDEIIRFLDKRKRNIDAVCLTGGEPTLYKDLISFASKIKELGLMVKLDTNGSNPMMVLDLIEKKLVDYIAMDIKTSKEKYNQAALVDVDMYKLGKSIDIIKKFLVSYEFRTTVIPQFFKKEDALSIGHWLHGAKRYVLQQYRSGKTLDPKFSNLQPYSLDKLKEYKTMLLTYFDEVLIRP